MPAGSSERHEAGIRARNGFTFLFGNRRPDGTCCVPVGNNFSNILVSTDAKKTWFDALYLVAERPFDHHWGFRVNYTLGKAEALGGEIAASRPICASGWLPMDRQVGSSGRTVASKLYLALGISGAIQHVVGMKGARSIIAVNKDSEAPIFEIADVAVIGNLFEIVPPLIDEVKKAKGT